MHKSRRKAATGFNSNIARVYTSSLKYQQRDSGSESAPLLSSSCSHASQELLTPLLLQHQHGSETSDLDSSPAGSSSKVSSAPGGIGNYNSIQNIQPPKRLPPFAHGSRIPSTGDSLPTDLERNNYYEIHNVDLLLTDDAFGANIRNEKSNGLDSLYTKSLPNQVNGENASKKAQPKQSSLVTIFSVWNTILGSSMLTMPWGIYMAGFIPAIVLILAMSGLCLFTAYKLLQVHKYNGGNEKIEVMELSRVYLGPWAEHMAKIFSISVLMGANIAYWVLMTNFLYNSVNFLYDTFSGTPLLPSTSLNKTEGSVLCPKEEKILNASISYENSYDSLGPLWDMHRTVPIFLAFLVFPVLNFNTTTFFTKFNSLGTASIIYLVIFVLVKSASWGINMDKTAWEDSWILRPTFPVLSGMLSLSFFIHNIIITIMQSNRDQKKKRTRFNDSLHFSHYYLHHCWNNILYMLSTR